MAQVVRSIVISILLTAMAANFFLPIFCHHGQDRQHFFARIYLPSHLLSAEKAAPLPRVPQHEHAGAASHAMAARSAAPLLAVGEELVFVVDTLSWRNALLATVQQTPLLFSPFRLDTDLPTHWVIHTAFLATLDLNLPPPHKPPKGWMVNE